MTSFSIRHVLTWYSPCQHDALDMPKRFFVYMMTNRSDGVLYIGVTSNLLARVHQHRTGAVEGFTKSPI